MKNWKTFVCRKGDHRGSVLKYNDVPDAEGVYFLKNGKFTKVKE